MKQIEPFRVLLFAALACSGLAAPATGLTLYFNTASPPLDTWTSQSIPLSESGWRVDNYVSGAFASQAEFQWVLGHLDAVYILTEWRTGPDDTNVDNISLGAGPSSTFDSDNEGWFIAGPDPLFDIAGQIVPTAGLGFDGAFGNPIGSVRVGDTFFWTWIGAPATYLETSPRDMDRPWTTTSTSASPTASPTRPSPWSRPTCRVCPSRPR